MIKNLYATIAENILHNFLEPLYIGSMVSIKMKVVSNIAERSIFACKYDEEQDVLTFLTGTSEESFKLTWRESIRTDNSHIYVLSKIECINNE